MIRRNMRAGLSDKKNRRLRDEARDRVKVE